MDYNSSSDSENDETLQVNHRKNHKFKVQKTFNSLAEAKKNAKAEGYSYNYRVKADKETGREVKCKISLFWIVLTLTF